MPRLDCRGGQLWIRWVDDECLLEFSEGDDEINPLCTCSFGVPLFWVAGLIPVYDLRKP